MPIADDAVPESRRTASFWRAAGYLTSLGWLMAVPIGLSVVIGYYLDQRLGTGHLWTMALLGVGIAVAAIEVYLALKRAVATTAEPPATAQQRAEQEGKRDAL